MQERRQLVELQIGEQEPDGAEHARTERHDDFLDLQRAREIDRMNAAIAAECNHREGARVAAAIGGDRLHGAHHVGIGDEMNAVGGFQHVAAERTRDFALDGAPRQLRVDRHAAARKCRGIEITQNHIGVGYGRLTTDAVTGRPGHRARAFRADLHGARLVEPDDAAAARAHLRDIDHRKLERIAAAAAECIVRREAAADLVFVGPQHDAAFDQRRLSGRAAHVE